MAYQQRWFRPCRKPAGPLKDDFVADDRDGAYRPRSMRSKFPWRRIPAWSLICLTLLAAPLAARGQPNAKAEGDAAAEAPTGLPKDYEPPRDPPPEMLFEKRLLTPEEQKKIGRELNNKYLQWIRKGEFRTDAAKTDVVNGIRYRLNDLTIRDNLKQLAKFRIRLTGQDLQQAGNLETKADKRKDFRRQLLQMVVDEVVPLFENNYYVRVQAALILGELNLMEEDARAGIKREAFAPAAKPLCRVLENPEQPEGVKIVSVLSLIRILNLGNLNVEQKREIATALVSELQRTDTHEWYQRRLAEALGYVDVSLDLNRQPFVFNVLNSVLNDPNRHLRTRLQAAWSLGRHPLEKGTDVNKLVVDVAALGRDIAQVQADRPKHPDLRSCAWLLYTTFQPKDENDKNAKRDREQKGGLLNEPSAAAAAKEAYQQVLPIVREILAGKPVPAERVQELDKWLEARGHRPKEEIKPAAKPPAVKPSRNPPAEANVTGALKE